MRNADGVGVRTGLVTSGDDDDHERGRLSWPVMLGAMMLE